MQAPHTPKHEAPNLQEALLPEPEIPLDFHKDIFEVCSAMISRLVVVIYLAATALASPISGGIDLVRCLNKRDSWGVACSDHRRHFYCDNLPGVRAGTGAPPTRMKPRNQSASLSKSPLILQAPKSSNGSTYCEPQTDIFIVMFFNAPNAGVQAYLNTCLNAVQRDINNGHTGAIRNYGWRGPLGRNGLHMLAFSEADHQMTYGVLHSAIHAAISWMSSRGHTFGTGGFTIWDGDDQVGHAEIAGRAQSYD